ncbi:aspartate aminotransferase family protein [Lacipirellula sp.]|uniref:aspartate aminotransferase family protein n=1 Tax=Lacipirellula sp. TaxID=2691419 RepID=UPI003D0DED2B
MSIPSAVERSLSVFPAGCNGEFNLPPRLSKVIVRGAGCELWTSDGERMIDFSMGWGSVLPGHAHPAVVEAVREQVGRGTNFSYVTEASLQLAEEILAVSPACDQLRFAASGTEATMYCLRLARAFTGRPKILKFEGAYHGSHDVGVVSLFPSDPPEFPQSVSSSAGIEPGAGENTLVAPFNDLEKVAEILERHGHEIAGVIAEPFQRCISPLPGFLAGLKQLVHRAGALLIFDEVVTGFRLAYGGAQEYYGVIPDLVAYGKALGGGLPIGAYGGRRQIMEQVCEDQLGQSGYVWTASTLGGNPVSTAAASAALSLYRGEGVYARLHRLGAYLRRNMATVLAEQGVNAQILGDGPIAQVAFTDVTPRDYRTSRHLDARIGRKLMLELFERGVFLNPMGTKLYLSMAHTEATCDEFCERFAQAVSIVTRDAATATALA